ncbi:MAG: hypothetical protein IJ779_00320 [Ruminococcus sp.]|nr:hypothetical protein [Ruminococcus sp.]
MKEFDIFRNTDEATIERIANIHPILTEEEKERMFSMSERKFNIKEKKYPQGYSDDEYDDDVDGVEEYDSRPAWLRYLTTAAALVLLGGALAVGHNLLRRRPAPENNNNIPPSIATELATGTTITSGADNSKYTTVSFDIDAMLTGTGTTQVPAVIETTAAQPVTEAPTAAPTAAPTEAPTEAPTPDIAAYKAAAKELESKWLNILRYHGDYYGTRQMDINDQFIAYIAFDDGINEDIPITYVRIFDYGSDVSFKTLEEYYNYYNSVFASGSVLFNEDASYVEPGGRYYTVPVLTEYNGKMYHSYYPQYAGRVDERMSGFPADDEIGSTWIGWEFNPEAEYDEVVDGEIIVENATLDSFDAIIPVCTYSPYGELRTLSSYDDNYHNYRAEKWHFVNEGGQWKIDFAMASERFVMDYDEYIAKVNGQ